MTIDVDELIDLLEKKLEEKEIEESDSPISKFVSSFGIRSGGDRVPNYVIFHTYKVKFKGELSKVQFFREFSKLFKTARNGRQRSYLLEEGSFDLTREGKIEAKAHEESYNEEVGLKTGKIKRRKRRLSHEKKQRKISESK
jgi:hypothetical protein